MPLFVGLGNPGPQHAANRHNLGFLAVDTIALRHGVLPWRKRFAGEFAEGPIGRTRVQLLKPLTYMNDAGRAVQEAVQFY
ncbi:MAG: peptidyl-tRNA hydrolase, family, partial [Variibacter sp.]|nr:peptidyl-tRNA hydrolase, family [Variibacter sp.]